MFFLIGSFWKGFYLEAMWTLEFSRIYVGRRLEKLYRTVFKFTNSDPNREFLYMLVYT